MVLDGEIILIDNDRFEYEFLIEVLKRLDYSVHVAYMQDAKKGYDYIKQTKKKIFLIICEIDFNVSGGFALKELLDKEEDTRIKTIPFVFIANSIDKSAVDSAYKHNIQGLFQKPEKLDGLTDLFSVIIKYWISNVPANRNKDFYD